MDKQPNAIEKALDILMAFTPNNRELGTVDLGQKTGFHLSTVNRTLKILAKKQFLEQNPITKKFALGPSVFGLFDAITEYPNEKLIPVAIPFLNELRDKIEETVLLEVMPDATGIVLYTAHARRPMIIQVSTGRIVPIHASAGCKAIIAFFEPHEIEMLLQKKKMQRWTKNTITEPFKLKRHLSQVKKDGIAFSREEIDEGINGIGAPIFNHSDRPVASAVIVGPSSRVKCTHKSHLVVELKKTVSKISSQLFHPDSMNGIIDS